MDLLRALLFGLSPQRPQHSLFIGGEPLPLEARMAGIFLGFGAGLAWLALLRRLNARGSPRAGAAFTCWGLVLLMALDGLNAVLFDGRLPHAYVPNTAARLLTGLGAGYAFALLALPVIAAVVWKNAMEDTVADPLETLLGLAAVYLVGAMLLADVAILLWPVAVLTVASVVGGFTTANLYLLALARGRRFAATWLDLASPTVAAVGLALIEVAAFGGVRWILAAQGASWG